MKKRVGEEVNPFDATKKKMCGIACEVVLEWMSVYGYSDKRSRIEKMQRSFRVIK